MLAGAFGKEYRHLEKPGIRQPFAEDRLVRIGSIWPENRCWLVQIRAISDARPPIQSLPISFANGSKKQA